MTKEEGEEIIKRLKERGVKLSCPMCGNNNFHLAEGYFNNTLQSDLKNFSLGGTGIPTAPIICTKCGFTSQHAIGVLGLLNKDGK